MKKAEFLKSLIVASIFSFAMIGSVSAGQLYSIKPGMTVDYQGYTFSCDKDSAPEKAPVTLINTYCRCEAYSMSEGNVVKYMEYSDGSTKSVRIRSAVPTDGYNYWKTSCQSYADTCSKLKLE